MMKMMDSCRKNSLIVIENGQMDVYNLDDKTEWKLGRRSKDNEPDIRLHSRTISRKHGRFANVDGSWFYLDNYGKNGTVYNGKYIEKPVRVRKKPVILKDGDQFIFGGGEEAQINCKTAWALFSEKCFSDCWRREDTKGLERIAFEEGGQVTKLEHPEKGTVVQKDHGLAIYMGDVTYLAGEISVKGF